MLLIISIIIVLILLEAIIFYATIETNKILTIKKLFPKIPKELIDKFNSHDPELGWVNHPNTVKKDEVCGTIYTYTFGQSGERVFESKKTLPSPKISTYGDSFCQCREVNDNETWQYYLYEKTGIYALNFGVGNYGFDQALLRLKREYDNNPTEIVIINVVPYTIERILSYWKHIQEPGNILNFKPRYKLDKNNKLTHVPNLIQSKEQLLNYDKYKIIKHDGHIKEKFKQIYKFPYIFSYINNPYPFNAYFISRIARRFLSGIRLRNFSNKILNIQETSISKKRINYLSSLYTQQGELLNQLVNEFHKYSLEKNFKPIIATTPGSRDVDYYKMFYRDLPVKVILMDLSQYKKESLYVLKDQGHPNAQANKIIADIIAKNLEL